MLRIFFALLIAFTSLADAGRATLVKGNLPDDAQEYWDTSDGVWTHRTSITGTAYFQITTTVTVSDPELLSALIGGSTFHSITLSAVSTSFTEIYLSQTAATYANLYVTDNGAGLLEWDLAPTGVPPIFTLSAPLAISATVQLPGIPFGTSLWYRVPSGTTGTARWWTK